MPDLPNERPDDPAGPPGRPWAPILGIPLFFVLLALVTAALGWVDPAGLEAWILGLRERPILVALGILGLLAVDSLLSVPTVATAVVAGHLLGPLVGGLVSSLGILAAGSLCFWGARWWGAARWVAEQKDAGVRRVMERLGPGALLFSRALPMLPEIMSALAGAGGVSARSYYGFFAAGNVPFALAAAWAGSVSSIDDPWPAVIAAVALPGSAGVAWLGYRWLRG